VVQYSSNCVEYDQVLRSQILNLDNDINIPRHMAESMIGQIVMMDSMSLDRLWNGDQ
jgi:hypothetical protein